MSFTHAEVDDLVGVVRLLEHDELISSFCDSIVSFIFVNFFGHKRPGIRAFESPLDSQRGFAPFVCPGES